MTFTIPVWVLWTLGLVLGVPAVIAVIVLAALGFAFIRAFNR